MRKGLTSIAFLLGTVVVVHNRPLMAADQASGAKKGSSTSHQKGRAPRTPRSQLPEKSPLSVPNDRARRSIAEGPTADELSGGVKNAELELLRTAEQVLFPQTTPGIRSSWSFELPEPSARAEQTFGLPLTIGSDAEGPGVNREELTWLRSLTLPDLPLRLDRRVVTYLKFYRDSHRGRTIAAIWARKSGRYVAEMKARFRRAGLPTDLVWLSMIESGHNPTIQSPAGAVGLWQFMKASGKMYGLTVDRWVDERRDPARATQAAIRFLSDLHQRFGNWELAMGAYNMGYAGMSRAVAKYNTNDYWTLCRLESGIPWETTLYVPKIFALAIVMNNRQAFGIGRTKLDAAESFDTILVEPGTSLSEAAHAAALPLSELQEMNPQYIASRLPPVAPHLASKWPLRIPPGTANGVLRKLGKLDSGQELLIHRVRLGDTIELLASDYAITEDELKKKNALTSSEVLEVDTVLVLPSKAKYSTPKAPFHAVVNRELKAGADQKIVYYQVRSGDELGEIAAALGVNTSDLVRYNALSVGALLRSGMTLQVLVSKTADLARVRTIPHERVKTLLAGSSGFHEYFEALKGKERALITVRRGDTLRKIGLRYGMSVGSMERVNRRSRKTELIAGERVVVYTEKNVKTASQGSGAKPLPELLAPHPEVLP